MNTSGRIPNGKHHSQKSKDPFSLSMQQGSANLKEKNLKKKPIYRTLIRVNEESKKLSFERERNMRCLHC